MSSLSRLTDRLGTLGLPALFVSDITNVQWLTGFTGSSGFVVLTPGRAVFVTDGRYDTQAHEEVKGFEIVIYKPPMTLDGCLAKVFADVGVKSIGFEDSTTCASARRLRDAHPSVEFVETKDAVHPLRMVKEDWEVAKIVEACRLSEACLEHSARLLQPGVSEREIAMDIRFYFERQGTMASFGPIVASGPNSAKPHAKVSDRVLQKGDFVTIDWGCWLDGYSSDITRTFVIGEATDRHNEVYQAVLDSLLEATKALVPGNTGKAVDSVARDLLTSRGLGEYFTHGLGHGLGRAVHDPGSLSPASTFTVGEGNVYTVEPGVYIDGFGGVRIEDDVHVTAGGPVVLTRYPRELTVV